MDQTAFSMTRVLAAALLLGALAGPVAFVDPAQGADGGKGPALEEGREITIEQVAALRERLPAAFWEHRDLVFYPGMQLLIGPAHRDYSPPPIYQQASTQTQGTSKIGPEGTLLGYTAGRPFSADSIDCKNDPEAGTKWIWNLVYRWQGFGYTARFRYTYWNRGQQRPLLYQGRMFAWLLKHRAEPRFQTTGGDVFPDEKRALALRFEVEKPEEASGTRGVSFRYESSLGPPSNAKPDDTYAFIPAVRRVRKISQDQRNAAVAGTDFTFDDLFSFWGRPPDYRWRCVGEQEVFAPMNTRLLGYPLSDPDHPTSFGPSGLSFANDRWELRSAVILELIPRNPAHPYAHKQIWIDRQTGQPLYSFAYDRAGALWKIIYHDHRWSEDALAGIAPRDWYPGWDGVPRPRDLRVVSDTIFNVQTGTGTRLEFWDSRGLMPDLVHLQQRLDIHMLRRDLARDHPLR